MPTLRLTRANSADYWFYFRGRPALCAGIVTWLFGVPRRATTIWVAISADGDEEGNYRETSLEGERGPLTVSTIKIRGYSLALRTEAGRWLGRQLRGKTGFRYSIWYEENYDDV